MLSLDTHFLGRVDYAPTYAAMQAFTDSRQHAVEGENGQQSKNHVRNQLWICEHSPVFTQGLAGKPDHLLLPGDLPVVQTNRGGQVTYHGPGQVVAYPLLDLKALGYYVKEYVFKIEEAVIRTLAAFNITGHRVRGAPGIYVRTDDPASHARLLGVDGQPLAENALGNTSDIGKIAALGIKVSRHFSYHGVALNVAMDLEPYDRINSCGYAGLRTVDMASLGASASWDEVAQVFAAKLCTYLQP